MPPDLGEERGDFLPHAAEGQPINESPEHLGEGHEGARLLLRSERAGRTNDGPAAVRSPAWDQGLPERQGAEPGGKVLARRAAARQLALLSAGETDLTAPCPDAGQLGVRTCMLGCSFGSDS